MKNLLKKLKSLVSSKKGAMGIDQLTPWMFAIFMTGIFAAAFLVILSKFGSVSTVTGDANTTINALISAIGDLGDWFSILILIGIMSVVLLVLYGVYYMFAGGGKRR